MRVRNIANARESLAESPLVIQQPALFKGKWRSILNRDVLAVEIGCGKGGYTAALSQEKTELGIVAIEKNSSIAYLASKKISEINSDNVRLINNDASFIDTFFEAGEVDYIFLNFSDPWPKKRAHKRRLSSIHFLNQYAKILNKDGVIIMKTDNYDLFIYSLNSFIANDWELVEVDSDFRSSPKDDPMSEYEEKFTKKGVKINRLIVRRKKDD